MMKYIVDFPTITKAVKFGLEQSISDKAIIDRLLRPIVEELDVVLYDDCEKWEEVTE